MTERGTPVQRVAQIVRQSTTVAYDPRVTDREDVEAAIGLLALLAALVGVGAAVVVGVVA